MGIQPGMLYVPQAVSLFVYMTLHGTSPTETRSARFSIQLAMLAIVTSALQISAWSAARSGASHCYPASASVAVFCSCNARGLFASLVITWQQAWTQHWFIFQTC